jgi:DNA-binding LytR/AlgR family response regulator
MGMDQLLRYLIVEDDEIDRLIVETEADKFPFLQRIASCAHPLEAVELIRTSQPDVLFVDIEMPDISGLQLVKIVAASSLLPVFITSHPEFAIESYEIEAFDYLLKPLVAERFARCALRLRDFCQLRNRAFAFEQEQGTDTLVIKQGHEKHKLRIADIFYLEAMKDYTRIIVAGKQYLVLATLSNMQEQLPPQKFVRIHRSYIVNLEKVASVRGNRVFLPDHELPVGKLYKNAMKGLF